MYSCFHDTLVTTIANASNNNTDVRVGTHEYTVYIVYCVVILPKQRQHLSASYVLMLIFSLKQTPVYLCADGELFTATKTDFRGIKPQILRYFSKGGRPDVSLETSISLLEGERT